MQEYKVLIKNKETDNLNTAFGIRTIKMDAQKGLSVNDKNLELKGGCIHHDNGPLGSASIDRGFPDELKSRTWSGYEQENLQVHVYTRCDLVKLELNGNGKLAGAGNGNPGDVASFQPSWRRTYQGKCLAIIRPEVTPGKITIKATSEGLKECSLELTAE